MSKLIKKSSIALVSLATVVSLSGAGALLPVAYGMTAAELQATINTLLAQITALQSQLAGLQGGAAACSFTRDLTVGVKGDDVKCLQQYLVVSPTSGYFGPLTKSAVAKWQAEKGVSPAVGYFGSISRAKYSAVAGGVVTPTTPTTPTTPVVVVTPLGTGLTVTLSADQPVATLAPGGAARVPFTKVNLTASADGDVVVNYLTVERTGLAADAAFASVVLLDVDGNQIGLKKTLNSAHQANVGEATTIKAGTTKVVTVAANRGAVGDSYGGQTAAFKVVAVGTAAAINGTLPIVGTTHTVNSTLTIGSVTMARGGTDPGASATKNIGETNYVFSGVRVTCGSAEKVYLKSIRWNQTGSAGATSDLANIKTYVDSVAYPTVVSADGKYYTTNFPGSGILVDKGFNKDIEVKGDIIGGSARTVDFDIAKMTDLFIVGENFGYGIIPPITGGTAATADSAAFNNTEDPWYDAGQVLINHGTMTVSNWSGVPAQNIAINLNNQPLGGYSVEVKGEPISVSSLKVNLSAVIATSLKYISELTNVSLVDASGKTLAGPIDVPTATTQYATITFTDTISFPVGITNITLKGKLGTGFANGDTIEASTTPSGWTATGGATGDTITPTPSSGALDAQIMTVKGLALTISMQTTPGAQTVVGGTQGFEMARYTFDASQSGEDARMSNVNLNSNWWGLTTDKISGCKLYDGIGTGAALLTSGNNVKDPTAAASSTLFTFDTPLVVAKGTSKTISLKCDLSTVSTTGDAIYSWGIDTGASFTVTGVTSGQSITNATVVPAANDSNGLAMTLSTGGTYTVVDDGTDGYNIVTPGTDVTLAKLKFTASTEAIDIKKVALILSGTTYNTPKDLLNLRLRLYDAANPSVLLGTADFVNEKDYATSTEITGFKVQPGASNAKTMLVKGTIADISDISGGNAQLLVSGDLLKVDYDGGSVGLAGGNYGIGGAGNVNGYTISTTMPGVRIMKAKPVLTSRLADLPKSSFITGTQSVYRFSIKAQGGDVDIYKLTFTVGSSTVSATTSEYALYAWTGSSYTGNIGAGWPTTGLLNSIVGCVNNTTVANAAQAQDINIYMDKGVSCGVATTTLKIPSGSTYYFDLQAKFANVRTTTGSESVTFQLEGDSVFYASEGMAAAKTIDTDDNNDFIWSPDSTTSGNRHNFDFSNGYGVDGLPSSHMTQQTLTYTL